MSKVLAPIPTVFTSLLLILQFFTFARAAEIDVRIKIKTEQPVAADVSVSINETNKAEQMWFMDQYGEISGLLTGRISHVYFYDKQGFLIARKRMLPNENVNIRNVGRIAYSVDLTPRPTAFAAAHVSWAKTDGGLLVLDDLLPQGIGKMATVDLALPDGWRLAGEEPSKLKVAHIEKASFYVGSNIRNVLNGPVMLTISGEWLFTDADASKMAGSLVGEYEKVFGKLGRANVYLQLLKFPTPVGIGNWEADTRGLTVIIASSDMPFKNQSVQRLHEQLRHELFHLWIPNGVNLSGNYDWFYEGFALYQSLKVGVGVNQLRFEDFLDTLSRAYNIDASQTKRMSLINASANRWNGSNTYVYSRGMLLAFLCDIAMLEASSGKRSVTDLLREVITKHTLATQRIDGNTALVAIFKSHREITQLADRYITGSEPIAIETALLAAGIEVDRSVGVPKFKVVGKPSGKQKKILAKLGVDNWRR